MNQFEEYAVEVLFAVGVILLVAGVSAVVWCAVQLGWV